jgi:hypothetical protein
LLLPITHCLLHGLLHGHSHCCFSCMQLPVRIMDDLVHGRRRSTSSGTGNANARHGLLSFVRRRWGETARMNKAAAVDVDDAHLLLKDRRCNRRRRRPRSPSTPSPSSPPSSSSAPRSLLSATTYLASSFRSTTTHATLHTDSIGHPQHPGLEEEVPNYGPLPVLVPPLLPAPARTSWERNAKHPNLGYLVQVEEFSTIQDAVVAHNMAVVGVASSSPASSPASSLSPLQTSYDQQTTTTTRPRIFFYCCNCGRYDHDEDDHHDDHGDDHHHDDDDDDDDAKNEYYDLSVLIELLSDPLLVEALETLFRPVLLQTAPSNPPPPPSSRNGGADDPVVVVVNDDDSSSSSSMMVLMPSIGFCDEHGQVLTSLTLFELSRASLLDALCESYETILLTTKSVSSWALPTYVQLLRYEVHSRPRQLTVLLRNTIADAQVQLGRLDGVLHTQPHRWTTTVLPLMMSMNNNHNNSHHHHHHNNNDHHQNNNDNNNTDQSRRPDRLCDNAGEDWRGVSALTITYDSRRLSFSQACRRVLLGVVTTGSQGSSVVQIVCSSHDEMVAARLEIAVASSSSSSRGFVTYRGHHYHHHPQVTTVAVLRTERQQQHQGGPSCSSFYDDHYPPQQQHEEQPPLPSPQQGCDCIRHLSSAPSYLYLHRTVLRLAPMTNLQALQMNALCRCPSHCHEAVHLLSPRQVAILRQRLLRRLPPQQCGSDTNMTTVTSSSSSSSSSLPSMIGITPLSTAWRMASLCGYGDAAGADKCAAAEAANEEEEEEDAAPEMYHLMGQSI